MRNFTRASTMARQAGLTLVEFMVAIVIGMLMVAALATLIANQSENRTILDRTGKMIENGRYALSTVASDVQMAGYWGELTSDPDAPAALPDPCSVTVADLDSAMGVAIQGYDSPSTLPTGLSTCISNHQPGTDILVVRSLDPDTSAVETAGSMDLTKLTQGQVYVQTGLDSSSNLDHVVAAASSTLATNTATFNLTRKTTTQVATLRKYRVHIYYISKCSVEVSGSCTNADGGTPIPTLKRVELSVSSNSPSITCSSCKLTIAEGIENMQINYGFDTDSDGQPNGTDRTDVDSASATPAAQQWANVMSVKIYLLARGSETVQGYTDEKSYALGGTTVSAANDHYMRHVFVQSVRLVNPSSRRL